MDTRLVGYIPTPNTVYLRYRDLIPMYGGSESLDLNEKGRGMVLDVYVVIVRNYIL